MGEGGEGIEVGEGGRKRKKTRKKDQQRSIEICVYYGPQLF